jgi:hypothetical protein
LKIFRFASIDKLESLYYKSVGKLWVAIRQTYPNENGFYSSYKNRFFLLLLFH